MNCHNFMDRIEEYIEGSLAANARAEAAAHLADCKSCQQRVARIRTMRAALRTLPVPEPRAQFLQQALAQAQVSQTERRWRWPYVAGTALAASLALWLGFGWLPSLVPPWADKPVGVTITLHEPRAVQLAFSAEHELQQATLSIRLPDGVELQGFPGQREVRWQTDLAQGVNMLSLPLVAVSSSGGMLLARLEHGERATEITVPLHVNAPGRTSAVPRDYS